MKLLKHCNCWCEKYITNTFNGTCELWRKASFYGNVTRDLLCNNISDSWNNYILEARDHGITVMLEIIRRMVVIRLQEKMSTCKTIVYLNVVEN